MTEESELTVSERLECCIRENDHLVRFDEELERVALDMLDALRGCAKRNGNCMHDSCKFLEPTDCGYRCVAVDRFAEKLSTLGIEVQR